MPPASARDNLHSRIVVILKVTLPLVALAILSSLFLFSRKIDPEDAIPYAEVDIADRLARPRMTDAGYSTTTSDGASLTIAASQVAPGTDGAMATGLTGVLETADGARTEFSAADARLDGAAGRLDLSNGVELRSSSGVAITAEGLVMATDRTWLESRGQVEARGPFGTLSAGQLRLDRGEAAGSYVLVFNAGVRLLYQPGS